MRTGLWVYFGLGTVAFVGMVFTFTRPDLFLWCWTAYQVCRVAGIGYVTLAIVRDR